MTKSIGSAGGRDYSSIQAWEDALPADLVLDGNSQVGECYNDSEFAGTSGSFVTFGGCTCDATHDITLTCHAGQSFRDNPNIQTAALRYNQSNGVAITNSSAYDSTILLSEDYVTLRGLQISGTGFRSRSIHADTGTVGNCVIDDCLVEGVGGGGESRAIISALLTPSLKAIRNCLVVHRGSDSIPEGITLAYASCTIVNNTVVCNPASVQTGYLGIYVASDVASVIRNNAIFGFTLNAAIGGNGAGTTCEYNAADTTLPGTNNQASKTYANQFQDISDATRDLRLKVGADCVDTGVTDATNGTPDIAGTARPSGSAYDIGCWELVQAAVPSGGGLLLMGVG